MSSSEISGPDGCCLAAGVTAAAVALFRTGLIVEVAATTATTMRSAAAAGRSAVGATSKHAEVTGDDLETCALLAFFVLPFARLNTPFDKDEGTLLQVLLRDFGLFAPDDNLVPLGALLALAVFVFVGFVGGDGEIRHGLTTACVASFGIAAKTTDEDHFIYGHVLLR